MILSDIVCFFTVASSSSIEAVACTPATQVLSIWSARASKTETRSALAFVQKSLPSHSIFSVECSLANVVFAEVSCQNGITRHTSHVTRHTSHFTFHKLHVPQAKEPIDQFCLAQFPLYVVLSKFHICPSPIASLMRENPIEKTICKRLIRNSQHQNLNNSVIIPTAASKWRLDCLQ